MSKPKSSTIEVQGTAITIVSEQQEDYISLTDIARYKDSERTDYIVQDCLWNRNTVEFLGVWERLKDDENHRLSLAWNLNRTLSKLNYRIHTDAVKAHLIPPEVTPAQAAITYATEADLLNVALFGQTARQWREANPKLEGNVREYASVEQLLKCRAPARQGSG